MSANKSNIWFPDLHEIAFGRNDNYLKGLFVGLTAPVLNLPHAILSTIIMPMCRAICIIGMLCLIVPIMGVFGVVVSERKSPEEALVDLIKAEDDSGGDTL